MDKAPVRIIQISDIHLMADQDGALLSVKTEESLHAILDLLKHEKDIVDLILLTGDLSQDGSAASYKKLATLLKTFSVPAYFVYGNHDYPQVVSSVYPCETISNHKHIVLKDWHLILLNSQKPGAVEGYLDESQLDYLQHCLEAYPEHHAVIVFHHQPVPVGCAWLDKLGVTNADALWEVLKHYPKVNTILFGHVHQEFEQVKNGVKCYAAPSTCVQFKRKQDIFGLEKLSPGYRWIDLYEDGRLETGVERVANYIGIFESDAKGY